MVAKGCEHGPLSPKNQDSLQPGDSGTREFGVQGRVSAEPVGAFLCVFLSVFSVPLWSPFFRVFPRFFEDIGRSVTNNPVIS